MTTTEVKLGEFFNQTWEIYRKAVQFNLGAHKEIAIVLRDFLAVHAPTQFSLLDIGCGDAVIATEILKDVPIARYLGVDLSKIALNYAKKNMESYNFNKKFIVGDFKEVIIRFHSEFDIVVAGYSVHHLLLENKLDLFRDIRSALKPNGYFIIYDPMRENDEKREVFLKRQWENFNNEVMTDEEKNLIYEHFITSDYPESFETLRSLAQKSGFLQPQSLLWDDNKVINLSVLPISKN